ncbi:hypothetical protein EGW08_021347 [Elysia chlorotica]|uniref:Mos1 transposase HTH domain-containing protein n=1 Tax=Elysia chlorotica TaxID=188477 RepID=A0A3S1ASI7_ELYCH|nr:hypothetical protein EGW08_021347 [Elysia chlorotica]
MVEVYAEKCPNYSTVTHWVRKFKSGFLSVMDEPREGRPTSVVTEKNVSTVEGLVKQDRRITVKQLASETRISVAPSDFCLFPNLKKSVKGRRFEDIEDAVSAVEEWFQAQNDTFYSQGLLKVKDRWQKCVTMQGDYVEK